MSFPLSFFVSIWYNFLNIKIKEQKMSKALIFDLDGTLADTLYSILDAIHPVFLELNFRERR